MFNSLDAARADARANELPHGVAVAVHVALLKAVQLQAVPAVTPTLPGPPVELKEPAVALRV